MITLDRRKPLDARSWIGLLFFVHGSLALRIIGVEVPLEAAAGRDVLLQCHYDLEGSHLYALKWYKGSHEFYRFVLKQVPPVQVFPWSTIAIHHEEARSRAWAIPLAGRVLLRNVTLAAEGVYKCEISTEAPYFDTDYREANLSVIDSLDEKPAIVRVHGRPDWRYGDAQRFQCSMNATRPPARLSWLINGQPAPRELVEDREPVPADETYWTSRSELRLELLERHFVAAPTSGGGELEITCVARVTRHDYDVLESRAKWLIDGAATSGTSVPEAATIVRPSPGDAGPDAAGDADAGDEDEDAYDDGDEYEQVARNDTPIDSDAPSRRSRPVVGSYPGRKPKTRLAPSQHRPDPFANGSPSSCSFSRVTIVLVAIRCAYL